MMWPEVIFTGVSAIAAGALAVPAARNAMLGNVELDWIAGELELDYIDQSDRQTVHVKNGPRFRVFRLRGVSYDAKVDQEQTQMHKIRTALIHDLGSKGVDIFFYGVKRQEDISFEAEWPSPALTEIAEAERKIFKTSFYVEWFLLLSAPTAEKMVEGCRKVTAMLSKYRPVLLTSPEDRSKPCPLTGFLNYLVCGELRRDLPAVSNSISGSLPASDLSFDKTTGTVQSLVPRRKLHKIIAIRQWPEIVNGRLIANIMALQGDVEVSQICEPMDREKALILYGRRAKEQKTPIIGNDKTAAECIAILKLIKEGNTTVFNTQFQIIVRASTEDELENLVAQVCAVLGNQRVDYSIETEGAPICWLNRIPKAKRSRIPGLTSQLRQLDLREQNISALWAFHHSAVGLKEGPYGDLPLRYLLTPSGQAYAFQFHVKAQRQSIGNAMLFAPSGGGKSTLVMHLLGGMAKFPNVRSYIFDSKEGARFMVEAMGGIYQGYNDLQLNPLDVGEDTPKNRHRIYMILKSMCSGVDPKEFDDEALNHAVELAFTLEPPQRTLNNIYEYAFAKRTAMRRAFARFVIDGKGKVGLDAHVFNAPHDSLGSFLTAAHMVGINMNEALDDPVIGPPVVAHIAEAIHGAAKSTQLRGFNIFIDEAAKLLQNDGFKSLAMEMYREYRKLDGTVCMAFQDPAALLRSGAADAFLENTATLMFLPNSRASHESLARFNLNSEQMNFVMQGEGHEHNEGQRQVLIIKQDAASGFDESAIVNVDLTPLGDCMRFYRAGEEANADLAKLKETWGDQWRLHL
ncbi:MAG: type IV secretion system protein VirB4 [Alphaproteobacteria bacterium]|nr:type IV secretion system protein VirB4 [Alphaproteobacteria bacterium]